MSNVKLISVTDSKDFTPEELIVYCARVSNPENQNNMETAPKLINYLIKHKHWSPFEMVDFTVEIKTTRGIAAQILRHRSFSFQEFCIAKDSLITLYYPETKNFKKITIENLYKRYKSSYWNRFKTPKVKVYDEKSKTFISAEIKEVFQTGIKPLYEIKLANGKSIKSTLEHKFFTKNGFSELANLQIGDYIAVNGVPCYENTKSKKTIGFSQIISIEYVGDDMTYDLEVNHVNHNYIANGIVTHNSQRYSKATKIIVPELRQSGATNRQSSLEPINNDELNSKVKAYLEISKVLYDELIEKGVAKECARAILPLNTETTLFMKGSVRSWIHYLQIRCEDATQLEHRLIALEIKEIFKTLFPNIKID